MTYAERYYLAVIRNGLPDPGRGSLSVMGAQAVRLRIAEIMSSESWLTIDSAGEGFIPFPRAPAASERVFPK